MEVRLGARPLNAAQQEALNDALAIAVREKDLDMAVSAVESGADANILMFRGIQSRQIEWVKKAVEHGADVNAVMSGVTYGDAIKSYYKYPVFFWLTRNFDPDIGDYLLSKGAKIDAIGPDGDSALLAAVKLREPTVIRYLVEQGADPLLMCADQKFPLRQLEDDTNWSDSSRKVLLVKAMVENLKKRNTGAIGPAAAPANDAGTVATKQDIEISRPLEIKPKRAGGFEL